MTVGNRWGYHCEDHLNYKSPEKIILQLQECAAKGGNLLLNIGPKADGSIPEGQVEVFKRVGAWMRVNGEAVYNSRPAFDSLDLPEGIMASVVWDDIYIFLPKREPGEEHMDFVLSIPANQVDAVFPEILGQEDCEVTMERVVEQDPESSEPDFYLDITIPAEAWENAVEGMPVLKLGYGG